MERFGPIQQNIVAYLLRCPERGGHVGPTTQAKELRGYDWEQVARSMDGLVRRGFVRRNGALFQVVRSE